MFLVNKAKRTVEPVKVLEKKEGFCTIVETKNNELLCIPVEDDNCILVEDEKTANTICCGMYFTLQHNDWSLQ